MKLKYRSDYKSIELFDPVELADCTILTGVNGSGKTHLLRALKEGHAVIDGIEPTDIAYFNLAEFKAENEKKLTRGELQAMRGDAWELFANREIPKVGNIRTKLRVIKIRLFGKEDDHCNLLESLAARKGKAILDISDDDFKDTDKDLGLSLKVFKMQLKKFFQQPELQNNPHHRGIAAMCSSLRIFPDTLTKIEFKRRYVPIVLKDGFLPMQLGQIFLDHAIKEYEEFVKLCDESHAVLPDKLREEARIKCRRPYNGKTPWDIINNFLSEYGDFQYSITYPDPLDADAYFYGQDQTFWPNLKTDDGEISIPYNELSSGEEVLFALALCLFKTKSDNVFPKVLLLDEIDASLHPSMVEKLFRVIENVFIKNGTTVILATHSPTTIALAPDDSVFVVNKTRGPNRIEKHDKKHALAILTQGFATLDEGLVLLDQTSQKPAVVITEGNNTVYIKKAIELFAAAKQDKIDVLEGIEGKSGTRQLKTLFDFFKLVPHKSHVFFVFDTDYRCELTGNEKTHPYTFLRNESNTMTKGGIENLFDNSMFGTFTTTTTDNDTHNEKIEFNVKNKVKFMRHARDMANEKNFRNFKPLIEHIIRTAGIDTQCDTTRPDSGDDVNGDGQGDRLPAREVR